MTKNVRDRGATLPLVALLLPVLVLMTAFSVDLGRQRALRRDLQANADVIALDLARLIVNESSPPSPSATLDGLNDSLQRNGMEPVSVADGSEGALVEWGNWVPPLIGNVCPLTIVTEPASCFQADIAPYNAVRVTLEDAIDYYFQPGTGRATRSAIAQVNPATEGSDGTTEGDGEPGDEQIPDPTPGSEQAYFQVGSFLLAVTPTSNTLIGQIVGQVVPGAEVLSYQGLVNARVTLGDLLLSLQAMTVDAGLDTDISYRDLLLITASALERGGGDTAAISLLNGMVSFAPTVDEITLGELVAAQAGGGSPAASATFDVLRLLTGGVFLITGDNAVSVPGTSLGIPGLGEVTLDAHLIERPQVAGPNVGAVAQTAQLQLGIGANLATSTANTTQDLCTLSSTGRNLLSGVLGLISYTTCTLGGSVNRTVSLQVTASLRFDVRAAGATSTLTNIDCTSEPPRITVDPGPRALELLSSVHLDVTAVVGGQSIGQIAAIDVPAHVLTSGSVPAETFLYPADFNIPRRTGSNVVGLAGLVDFQPVTLTAANVSLGPIINPVAPLLTTQLNTMLASLDSTVVRPAAEALGVIIGGADVTALSMACVPETDQPPTTTPDEPPTEGGSDNSGGAGTNPRLVG